MDIDNLNENVVDDEDDDDLFLPKTIDEVLDVYLASNIDFDLVITNDVNWAIAYLEDGVIEICNLDNNPELISACGCSDGQIKEAARVIAKKIWEYWNVVG